MAHEKRKRPRRIGVTVCVGTFLWFLSLVESWSARSRLRRPPSALVLRSTSRRTLERVDDGIRRKLCTAGILAPTLLLTGPSQNAVAADAGNPAEAFRRGAANFPGYGPSDVFYPATLQGVWMLRREVTFYTNGDATTLILSYPVRFLTSVQPEAVVADRGFNQVSLERALRDRRSNVTERDTIETRVPIAYEWSINNPNDLRITIPTDQEGGGRKEIKTTKRSTEYNNLDGDAVAVTSSEFQRVTVEDTRGIPSISARRVLTKWIINQNEENGNVAEGLEIVYDMSSSGGLAGDPMAFSTAKTVSSSSKPMILSKSRLRLERAVP